MQNFQIDETIKNKNRKKMITQNTKMYNELKRLERQIQALQEDPVPIREEDEINMSIKLEIESQNKQIRKLKQEIQSKRHQNIKDNVIYIRKQEDEVLFLKRQLQQLFEEKDVVISRHQDKLKKLAGNEPLQNHKDHIQSQWSQTKKENRQLNLKLVELERQIRKFHHIKESAKSKSQIVVSPDQEAKILSQIQRMNAEIKKMELKWKPSMQVLDNQFFRSRNQLQSIQKKIEDLQKQESIWKVRAGALRDQSKLQVDHKRISKLVTNVKQHHPEINEESSRYDLKPAIAHHKKSALISINKTAHIIRAQSTPSHIPSGKKILDLKNIHEDIQMKKQVKRSMLKQFPEQKASNSGHKQLMQSFDKMNGQKKNKMLKQFSTPTQGVNTNEMKGQIEKSRKQYIPIRERHRTKTHALSDLGEQIKKKADEIKKINADFCLENSTKKAKNSNKQLENKILTSNQEVKKQQVPQQSKKLKLKFVQVTSPKGSKLKNKLNMQPQQAGKDTISHRNQQNIEPIGSKKGKQIRKNENKKIEQNGKQMIQSINMTQSREKQKVQKPQQQKRVIQIKSPKNENFQSLNKQVKTKQEISPSPKSNKEVKPTFDIVINDHNKPKQPTSPKKDKLRVEIFRKNEDEQDTDNIPKIVKRKKPAEKNSVAMGTQT